jgi:hypothetical protein
MNVVQNRKVAQMRLKNYLLNAGSCDINESDQSKLGKIKVYVA